jgi:predicted HicB family RNase H-like nuclease
MTKEKPCNLGILYTCVSTGGLYIISVYKEVVYLVAKYTEARKQANKRWDEANKDRYARISLVMPADLKPMIQSAARATGLSTNQWILEAIKEKL